MFRAETVHRHSDELYLLTEPMQALAASEVLPTGKNMHALDPNSIPTKAGQYSKRNRNRRMRPRVRIPHGNSVNCTGVPPTMVRVPLDFSILEDVI